MSRIVVATTFGVHPPRGGGQARVAGLYGALARLGVEVDIISLVGRHDRAGVLHPAPGVRETRIPRTPIHEHEEWKLQQRAGAPVGDLVVALHPELTPAYVDALADAARGATAVVACHPYPYPALPEGVPLIYEAQDVEADLKAAMYDGAAGSAELSERVRELEGACCTAADHVLVCAARDGARLTELYGVDPDRIVEVPNGADPDAFTFTPIAERRARKAALGLGNDQLALFVGSWHEPNLAVIRDLLNLVDELDAVRVLICGSAGLAFTHERMPGGFDLCGVVDEGFLHGVLALADAALNPMRWGSGTNLKMFDYALAGVPIVSSSFGNRGIGFEPGTHFLPAEPEQLPAVLRALREEPADVVDARTRAAREYVEERFSWRRIAGDWHAHPALQALMEVPA